MSFEKVGVQLVAEDAAQFFGTMIKADQVIINFGQTADRTMKQIPSLSDIAVGALHKIGEVAIDAFMQAGQAAIGFFKDSISQAADFQDGMLQFQSVAGRDIDTAGLQKFHDLFLQLGKDLPVSTADVQQAAIELVKGGIDPATVAAGGLKASIQFAAAAMDGDLKGAAETSAKIVGGWADVTATAQEKADLLTHATDLLAKAANASTVDVHDLSLGLYNVQGTAKTLGLSLDETTTALAELAPRFANANTAGTSFRNFLVRLQPSTKPAIAAMQGLGLYTEETGSKFFDAKGNFIGVAKASDLLQSALAGLTKAQQTQALQTIFGNDAMNAAAAFADMGAKGYDAMATSLDKANGVAEAAALKQQSLSTAWKNFQGTVEMIQIKVGEALIPVLTELFTDVLQPAINTVADITSALMGSSDAFNNLAPPIQAVVSFVESLMAGSGGLSELWTSTLLPAVQAVGEYFDTTIAPILENLATALFPLLDAAVQIAGGIWTDVLVPALKLAWDVFNALIVPILSDVAAWLAKNLPPAIEETSNFFTTVLLPAIHDIYDFLDANIVPILKDVVKWLRDNVPPAIQKVTDFWNNQLLPALRGIYNFINGNIIPIFMTVTNTTIPGINGKVQGMADLWNNTLKPALTAVWDFIDKKIIPIFNAVANVISAVVGKATDEYITKINVGLLPGLQKVSDFLVDTLIPNNEHLAEGLKTVADFIRDTIGPIMKSFITDVLKSWADWFQHISDGISSVVNWLNQLAEKIRNLPSLPSGYVGHSPPPMAQWMGSIADQTTRAAMAFHGLRASQGLPANPTAMMAAAGNTSTTYNQSRTANFTYHTQYAPPIQQSMAIANALGY